MKTTTTALRRPYYQALDGIGFLQSALNAVELQDDGELLDKITELTDALDALRRHMDMFYEWD